MNGTGVAVMVGRVRFAWRPVVLEDGRVAFLRFVHELSPICGLVPLYEGLPVRFTDRIPHCKPALRDRINVNLIWMERSMNALIARLVVGWLVLVEAITLGLGFWFDFHPALNGFRFGNGFTLYLPGQFVTWYPVLHPADHWFLTYALYAALLLAAAIGVLGVSLSFRMKSRGDKGSRIASPTEARAKLR